MVDREVNSIWRMGLGVHSALPCDESQKRSIETEVDSISLSCTRFQTRGLQ